ncbi:P2X purinoceptor 4-like [Discoglossus pictus]
MCTEYVTNKEVRIKSQCLCLVKCIIWVFLVILLLCFVILQKGYQKTDDAVSSVYTKVKGVAEVNSRIWDAADHAFPSLGGNSFFVQTNTLITENQTRTTCASYPSAQTTCTQHDFCKKGQIELQSNGILTGRCIKFNSTIRTCEVSAWCPLASKITPDPAVLESAENFTVLIKNNIHFDAFNYSQKNTVPSYDSSCIYNRDTDPLCPIFRVGDIVKEAGENFSQVAVWGAIMGIEIKWDCNLDCSDRCRPQYSFRRLDKQIIDECKTPCFNFRYARYYKTMNGREERTLIKAYGIRFDIQVYGKAGKFDFITLIIFIGAYLSYFGVAQVILDFYITKCSCSRCNSKSTKKFYKSIKYEKVHGPSSCTEIRFVSFLDEECLLMVVGKLSTNLQTAKKDKVRRKRLYSGRMPVWTMEPNIQILELENTKPPNWCKCKMCIERDAFEDQLCCRSNQGECISTYNMFKNVVLNRNALTSILQYNNIPSGNYTVSNKDLVECAEKQYIQWCFGSSKDVMNFAMIPSCCKRAIIENIYKARPPVAPKPQRLNAPV